MDINRNQFLMIGLVLLMLGAQLRAVDTYVLNENSTRYLAKQSAKSEKSSVWSFPLSLAASSPVPMQRKQIRPPRWIAWALLSVGAVLVLHSFALKRPE